MSNQPELVTIRPVASRRLPFLLLLIGLVLTALGIWDGETSRILEKATQVCLQCIGIG